VSEVEAKSAPRPDFFWHILEESLDEAEYLWARWERSLDSHDLPLQRVAFWIENRLRGSLDGVRTAGDAAVAAVLEPGLASDSAGRVAASAYVLASMASAQSLDALGRALSSFAGPSLDAVRRGAERSDNPRVVTKLTPLLQNGAPHAQAAVLDLCSFRAIAAGAPLSALLESPDPFTRAAAVRAARDVPALPVAIVNRALGETDPHVLVAAIETGLWHGMSSAWELCLALCSTPPVAAACRPLLALLAMSGSQRAERALLTALEHKELQRDAVFALGVWGRVPAIDACLALMREGRQPRVAGEAFCAITGLDLAAAGLVVKEPEAPEAPSLEDENLDADLVSTIDEALPQPDIEGIAQWWQAHRHEFADKGRYLGGRLVDAAAMQDALLRGPCRRRHEIARELAIRSGGAFRVATRAFAHEQERQMERGAAIDRALLSRNPVPGWAPLF
jgi:uncharacterized protein (TIGR02270 family)